ncbi:Dyp-type peroxidase [Pseudonocardia sp.]|uniref:Dyp-type peroxidase n=1 Tax=Pseudonocardia sp. TaxID=60912 RepID=UPI003D13972A
MSSAERGGISRRRFVTGAAGIAAGTGLVAGAAGCAPAAIPAPRYVPFEGANQTGITALPIPARGLSAAFSVQSPDRARLTAMFQALSDETRAVMSGEPPRTRNAAYPPTDSGILGAEPPADDLSVVVAVGASLFDARFGLADRKPRELVEMPFLANDRLKPEQSHGDLLLTIEANHADTVQFALRQLMRSTRGDLVLKWIVEGYGRGAGSGAAGGTPRNLLGFKDGTQNLHMDDEELMRALVWVGPDDGEPAWAVGGSYQVMKIIRMFVEFWDRTPLAEQESIFGRTKLSGAPLGMDDEFDVPDYADDPDGTTIALDAHIRLANPRTPQTEENRILRRGFSYTRGFDGAGRLDQGLAFISYQRSLSKGFLTVQERIAGERLEEYVQGQGGGFFFALPGVQGPDRFLGDMLVS